MQFSGFLPLLLRTFLFSGSLVMPFACSDGPVPTPKPRAYPRITYPERTYNQYQDEACPFTFSFPGYAHVEKDADFFGETPINNCWFDLQIPVFNSTLFCSYYTIDDTYTFEKLRDDAFEMAYKHTTKANAIEENPFRNQKGTGGFTFNLEGPVASSFMFFISDSTNHFLRGSLYFNTQVNQDSLRPAFEFIREDLLLLLDSFEWK